MSFALDYRRRMQAEAAAIPRKPARPLGPRRMMGAFAVAALMLAAFDSHGLLLATQNRASGPFGRPALTAARSWHGLMQETGIAAAMGQTRIFVADVKSRRWTDVAALLGVEPRRTIAVQHTVPRADPDVTAAIPAMALGVPAIGN